MSLGQTASAIRPPTTLAAAGRLLAMCGRYVSPDEAAIERAWTILRGGNPFTRVFNAAPTMRLPVVRVRDGRHEPCAMHWGLVPGWWSKAELPQSTINARAEDAATKPMWRSAVRYSRCLVPSLGWYEWKTDPSRVAKQPYFIHRPARGVFCFAGLWSEWSPKGGEPLQTFAILTRDAVGDMTQLHNRMPLVLPPDLWAAWLDPDMKDGAAAVATAQDAAETAFSWYPVSSYVTSPRNQDVACMTPLA